CCFFFFSSRRRHTRFSRDWSSDVCSSDLFRREFIALFGAAAVWPLPAHAQQPAKIRLIGYLDYGGGISPSGGFAPFHDVYRRRRSEERRVGKECRTRW